MIKISMDNLFFWHYFFGFGFLVVDAFFIVAMVAMNVWFVYLIFLLPIFTQVFVAKAWRYLFIKDAYLSEDFKRIEFRNVNGVSQEFDRSQIVKFSNHHGITDVVIDVSGNILKLYFMINSKENLKYLKPS